MTYRGLAPKVKFVILKVLDKNGAGYTSDVIRAVDFAVANRAASASRSSTCRSDTRSTNRRPAIRWSRRWSAPSRAGVIVVAAAGNYGKNPTTGLPGYAGITSPGNAPSAITVGAVKTLDTVARSDDRIPDYSSSGPTWYDAFAKPDIVAPGPQHRRRRRKTGDALQDLSAAEGCRRRLHAPERHEHGDGRDDRLAGADARGESSGEPYPYDPSLTPNAVKAILQYTAIDIHDDTGLDYNALRQGAGALNPKGAIDAREIDRHRRRRAGASG